MKVLTVISQFYPIIGGAEKQAKLLTQTLIEKGLEAKVVTGWWDIRTPRKEKIDGIEVFRNFSFWGLFGIKGFRILGSLTYMISLSIYLFIHRRDYDIIHVHQALYPAFISVLVGKQILGKPVIVKTASSGITSDIKQLRRFPFGDFQLKYMLKQMDCLVAVSKISGKEFTEEGYPESRIVYIPNGVEMLSEVVKAYSSVRTVLTSARLSKEKGIDILLNAWAYVLEQNRGLRLVILGDGPLALELKDLSKALKITDSVDFAGMVHDVSSYLKDADLFVLPSRTEGMSNALLEAMSYGIPCIATNVAGNGELLGIEDNKVIPGGYMIARNGLLVNPEDVKGLSEAILYLVRNRDAREEIGRRSRAFIKENYFIDLIAERYIALYQRMIAGKS